MLALRKNSEDMFSGSKLAARRKEDKERKKRLEEQKKAEKAEKAAERASLKRKDKECIQQEEPEKKERKKKMSWREESARKLSGAIPAALRSPTSLLKKKKPLRPSLSWDPEHRSRSPSTASRSRIHSDGSEDRPRSCNSEDGKKDEDGEEEMNEPRFDLEITCAHCSLQADYRRRLLKNELESAVMRLARRLGNNGRQLRDNMMNKGPDIIVSSISSDEDERFLERNTSSERNTSLQTSETSSPCSSQSTSPRITRNGNDVTMSPSTSSTDLVASPSPLLRPPNYLSPYPDSSSPPRSNSIDLSTLRRDIELLSVSSGDSDGASDAEFEPPTPAESIRTVRSKSHDPSAPTSILRRPSRIEHLSELFRKALAKSPVVRRTAQEEESRTINKHRTARYWQDEQITPTEHIWLPSSGPGSSTSADTECYVGEKDCRRQGEKRRCASCHIIAHTACFSLLAKLNLNCKTTYRDHTIRKQPAREVTDGLVLHHWVHRWKLEGRCNACGKSYQQKMFNFQQKEKKETIAVCCSWCKESYHVKNCFTKEKVEERCDRGAVRDVMVPPSWILRLPTRKRAKHKQNQHQMSRKINRQFVVKPMPDMWSSGPSHPLIVFVNPKSGGNKGTKALHTLCWLLNPRQVFDITTLRGPKFGLEVYRKIVTQLRLLVCGGDGTVGWVLQTLDNLNWPAYPPMAIMPLGTGNDLSRCMGWGGTFNDEPLAQLLQAIVHETSVTHLDRWRIDVGPNMTDCDMSDEPTEEVQSSLPLTVMNNYFSIGADAHVALQFHQSRSANPQMLNSRLKNRIAYGGLGTIDLFKRSWKDLSDHIQLECDGVDLTQKIKDLKLHCILFHNISYYAGGTIPWGHDGNDGSKPSCCDGRIEVLGFTTATLAALQMGGKGERIAQCSTVRVSTTKAIPMQVDGEPCLLAPSVITLSFHSKVPMLKREKKIPCTPNLMRRNTRSYRKDSKVQSTSLIVQLPVIVVGKADYDAFKDCFERLKDTAYELGMVNLESEVDLDVARLAIQKMILGKINLPYEPSKEWRFCDYVTNAEEGTFRVPRHQEKVHSISDICNQDECILILDNAFPSITGRDSTPDEPQPTVIFTQSRETCSTARRYSNRRISETLRIVLCSDAQETHL